MMDGLRSDCVDELASNDDVAFLGALDDEQWRIPVVALDVGFLSVAVSAMEPTR
jgi:hypothetical protein